MILLSLVLCLCLDSWLLGLALGLGKARFSLPLLTMVFLLSTGVSALSTWLGSLLILLFPSLLVKFLSSFLLLFMGICLLFSKKITSPKTKNPLLLLGKKTSPIGWREGACVGFALSMDIFGSGIALGAGGASILAFSLLIGCVQTALLALGFFFGGRPFWKKIEKKTDLSSLSGGILLVLALFRLYS